MSTTYPPAPAALSDPNVTASRFLQNPNFVARRMQTLGEQRYIGDALLTGRQNTTGGAVGYELAEGIFADKEPEAVAPGSEYTLTAISDGPAGLARVAKWGEDTLITDESITRRQMTPVNKAMMKLVNSAALLIDQSVVSVVASAITATQAATAVWTGSTAVILRDILLAVSKVRALNLGYNPNALLVDDETWAYLASDDTITNAMRREADSNPIYSGRFEMLSGLQVMHTSAANLPGGVGTNAWVIDTNMLGFIATEDLGGGYMRAGELVETKVIRKEETDAWRLRARANFVPVVDEPGAGFKISGVRA